MIWIFEIFILSYIKISVNYFIKVFLKRCRNHNHHTLKQLTITYRLMASCTWLFSFNWHKPHWPLLAINVQTNFHLIDYDVNTSVVTENWNINFTPKLPFYFIYRIFPNISRFKYKSSVWFSFENLSKIENAYISRVEKKKSEIWPNM